MSTQSTEYAQSIYSAENLRVSGKTRQALKIAKPFLVNPNTIADMDNPILSDHIRQWRIAVVSTLSEAQKQWFASKATNELIAAKKIITTYYHHPEVQAKAISLLEDNEGHPYDFNAEMLRDIGKYDLIAYFVSRQRRFLDFSTSTFTQAVNEAQLPSPRGIALIELGQVQSLAQTKKTPLVSAQIYDQYIYQGFHEALPAIRETEDEDRLAWLLNTVRLEAIQSYDYSPNARRDYYQAEEMLSIFFGEERTDYLKRKTSQRLISRDLHKLAWRLTSFRVNFAPLAL